MISETKESSGTYTEYSGRWDLSDALWQGKNNQGADGGHGIVQAWGSNFATHASKVSSGKIVGLVDLPIHWVGAQGFLVASVSMHGMWVWRSVLQLTFDATRESVAE